MSIHHPQSRLGPVRLWTASTVLHRRGWRRCARGLKFLNWLVYKAVLPPEADVARDLQLGHLGLGVVVHPNTRIGARVHIWHQVTIGSSAAVGGSSWVTIEDDVEIGSGARIINQEGRNLVLAEGCRVGANAVVVSSVRRGTTVVGVPAREVG